MSNQTTPSPDTVDNFSSYTSSTSSLSSSPRQRTASASYSQSLQSRATSVISSGTAAIRPPIVQEINQAGWTFRSVRSSISSAAQVES